LIKFDIAKDAVIAVLQKDVPKALTSVAVSTAGAIGATVLLVQL